MLIKSVPEICLYNTLFLFHPKFLTLHWHFKFYRASGLPIQLFHHGTGTAGAAPDTSSPIAAV